MNSDTMRMPKPAAYIIRYVMNEPDVSFCKREGHECDPLFTAKQMQAAHEAGRQLGMEQARAELAKTSEAVRWRDVVVAINAVEAENARRGGMFPQDAHEHELDAAAVARIEKMLTWFGDKAYRLEAWPKTPSPQPAAELVALSDERRRALWHEYMCHPHRYTDAGDALIQAIERAHGIGTTEQAKEQE